MLSLEDLLKKTLEFGASDLHLTVGIPPTIRKNGRLSTIGEEKLMPSDTEALVRNMLNDEQWRKYQEAGELDLSFSLKGMGRFRVNVYKQRGTCCAAIRMVNLVIPSVEELGLPGIVTDMSKKTKGMILVTGPTGSGKSTTLALIIDLINKNRDCHILTLEDPIEYLHKHNKSIVNQREIGNDSHSYSAALRAALREDPDVILVGEMRDTETIAIAVTAAETGHLVLSTLHTIGAANTIDRIIDVFPPYQQQQIKVQLSTVIQSVISQQLLPRKDKPGRVPAIEIMVATPAVRNLIREGKTYQINSQIQTGAKFGMQAMDSSLAGLYRKGIISQEDAMTYAMDPDNIMRYMG
ncbi:twitching motility protein [Ruminiclostridium papyrosolvens DSM 2782]|uniref:Twitching motility protein n=1 Tax=Ruminiclostridium papyrosolvens DSM 2782 TaxID=588581 RepID=F1TIM0_9FIRM|nr:type IV pilus twitching motility protein PilT [Ruminiclostridium papyrosolvens]EGD45719.1 twitching motility protein [Ruminiclostridium papyrosolvens DSM 2782]WES35306.1 type IV pilus twitching motility protein PilT [Ruminiclostridium papyrosolvens DSM 2782]